MAPCQGKTRLMFDHYREREAASICSSCDQKEACLAQAEAIETTGYRSAWGVWGGLTAMQRLKLYEGRRTTVSSTPGTATAVRTRQPVTAARAVG